MTPGSDGRPAVAILAGGRGTRLRSAVPDLPKVLAPVAGRPFLAHLLAQLDVAGFREVVLCTGYRAEQVERTFGGRFGHLRIGYSAEDHPLGTGGALRQALPMLPTARILAMNGDSWCQVDLGHLVRRCPGDGASAALVVHHRDDTSRYGRVELDRRGRVARFAEKAPASGAGWINAGIYLLPRDAIASLEPGVTASLEREILPRLVSSGLDTFPAEGPFIDIGTPRSFRRADALLAAQDSRR